MFKQNRLVNMGWARGGGSSKSSSGRSGSFTGGGSGGSTARSSSNTSNATTLSGVSRVLGGGSGASVSSGGSSNSSGRNIIIDSSGRPSGLSFGDSITSYLNSGGGSGGGGSSSNPATATEFYTGNPEIDSFMNDYYIPLLAESFSDNPAEIFNDDLFKNIEERVNATWGPIFEKELNIARETYQRNVAQTAADFDKNLWELQQTNSRGQQDLTNQKSRILEDTRIGKERIARNLDEAKLESSLAMAARQLTFGGTRKKEEAKLVQRANENLTDLTNASDRAVTDIGLQQGRLAADWEYNRDYNQDTRGRALDELQSDYDLARSDIQGERQVQIAAEKERLRTLGSNLLSNPNFY